MATIPAATGLVAAALSAYPASMIMQKYGRKIGFQLGAVFALISGILTYYGILKGNFIIFAFGVATHGVFQAFSAYYRFSAMDVTPPHRHKQSVSYVLAGGILAAFFAPSAASYFESLFYLPIQYAGTYILIIVLSISTQFLMLFIKFPEQKKNADLKNNNIVTKLTFCQVLKRPAFLCASLNAAGGYLLMSYVMTSSPIQIVEYCGFPVGDAASVIQWHAVFMFLPAFFTGSLTARYGSIKIILTGMFIFVLSALIAIEGLELYNFYGSLILLGLGWNFMFIGGTTLLEEAYTEDEKAKVQGMNDFVVYSLTAFSTMSSGYILETFGWVNMNKMVFLVLGVLMIITLRYIITARKNNVADTLEP